MEKTSIFFFQLAFVENVRYSTLLKNTRVIIIAVENLSIYSIRKDGNLGQVNHFAIEVI